MGDDRVERRAILGVGASLLASLTGCSGLFIEPETTGTPGGGSEPTATQTPTATPAPTAADTATPSPTATSAPVPSEVVEIGTRRLNVDRSRLEKFALVTYQFEVENVGERPIRDIEFRVRLRYEHEEVARIVATAYPRFWFEDDADDDDSEGLETDETQAVIGQLRFERDGRAQNSTAADRFDIELTIRQLRYV